MLEILKELDLQLFMFLNSLNHPWIDPLMHHISKRITWVPAYAFLLFILYRRFGWRVVFVLLLVTLMITITDQFSGFLKAGTMRFRPSRDPDLEGLVHLVRGRTGGGRYGFVSAHAANSFALATLMYYLLRSRYSYIGYIFFPWAFSLAYSRVYLGVHYPGDIIAGTILGIAVGLGLFKASQWGMKKTKPDFFAGLIVDSDKHANNRTP